MFYRLQTDGVQTPSALVDSFAGPVPSACWLIGGGPSLAELPCEKIARSPIPRMTINLAGTRLMRPTFWTSYDPSARFHRSVYLDASVMKFVHRRRAMDLVPETTYKVCECPNTYFFERDGQRGYHDFLSASHTGIVDWADSMVQAIDILYRLGFRIIYLAGCEMQVRLSQPQRDLAAGSGVDSQSLELLSDFLKRAEDAGVSAEDLDALPQGPHYHFDVTKPVRAAANTDAHYFRISQFLRLSRRSLSLAGVRLISVTPSSRLNDYFPYQPINSVLKTIRRKVGDPAKEPVKDLYRQTHPRHPSDLGPMRDMRPHNWKSESPPPANQLPQPKELVVENRGEADSPPPRKRLRGALAELRNGDLLPEEIG